MPTLNGGASADTITAASSADYLINGLGDSDVLTGLAQL